MLSLPANPVRALAGSDPGRVRLTNAIAIASAVLLSTGSAIGITRLMHASTEYVTVGSFLAMIGGLSVKDATAHKRLATAALLALPALAMLSATALLDQWRYVEIALLVAVCTAATWVRRYGPRATAIGMVAFIAGFFGLIIRPSVDDLGVLALIVVATTACNVLVRLILLHGFPRHELRVLMREFRGACDTGLSAAEKGSSPALQKALDRISGVSVAVHGWQEGYDTRDCTGLDEAELSRLVFDARTDTVQACLQIAARPRRNDTATWSTPCTGRCARMVAAHPPTPSPTPSPLSPTTRRSCGRCSPRRSSRSRHCNVRSPTRPGPLIRNRTPPRRPPRRCPLRRPCRRRTVTSGTRGRPPPGWRCRSPSRRRSPPSSAN
ncbi:hypothetical protein ACFOJ6_10530 [Gordonia humi]|uniref:hypothetical protein n=1 Tax=Gordonia humi TaxID=686429 RepID=UPI00360FE332